MTGDDEYEYGMGDRDYNYVFTNPNQLIFNLIYIDSGFDNDPQHII